MAKNNHLISIIIPCFNSGQYLIETLESVVHQSYQCWECIIIDDGSSDNSQYIAHSYQERFPGKIFVYKNEGRGACAARNFGFKHCSGHYIKFLDSDDVLAEDNILEKQLNFLINSRAGVVYGNELYYHNQFEEQNFIKSRGQEINNLKEFFKNFPITSNFFIDVNVIKGVGWNEILGSGQEFFLLFQLFSRGVKFRYQATPICKIRVHDSEYRISNKPKNTRVIHLSQLVNEMVKEVRLLKVSDEVYMAQFKLQILLSSYQALRYKNRAIANEIQSYLKEFQHVELGSKLYESLFLLNKVSPFVGFWAQKVLSRLGLGM